jgi:hypothetical protein
MAYEVEAVADSGNIIPTQSQPVMRDERVFDPYGGGKRLTTALNKVQAQSGQQNTSERAAEEPKATTAETVTLSGPAAALARQQQKARQREQALLAKEKALEARLSKVAELEAMEAKLAAGDYSGLEGRVDYEKYTQHLLNKQAGADPYQETLKKIESKVDEVDKAFKDSISKQFDAAVAQRRSEVVKLVESSDDFAKIRNWGERKKAEEAVVQHILDTWEHDSKELSVEEAAKEVKEALIERAKRWAPLLDEPQPAPVDEKKQLPPLKQGLKTITNQVTTGEIKKPVKSFQHMSDSERYAEARRRAVEKLNSQQRQG